MRTISAIVVAMSVLVGCERTEAVPPERPIGVPDAATWGGGVDGGDWLHCLPQAAARSYDCSVYWDSDGALKARGSYVLRRVAWDANQRTAAYAEAEGTPGIDFKFFDGVLIHLADDLALVPDGTVDFPFGDGHGKRQRFELGVPQGPEQEY